MNKTKNLNSRIIPLVWNKEKLDEELEKGYADMLAGRTKPAALYLSEAKKKYKI